MIVLRSKLLAAEALLAKTEQSLREVSDRKVQLDDEVRWSRQMIADLTAQLKEARDNEHHSTQTVADFLSQWMFGRKIYAAAPDLPADSPENDVVRRPRAQGRRVVQQETARAMQEILEYEQKLGLDPDAEIN